ncbi:MAG: ankyrin repeat domain-containing protein, partial [Hylemonella sp.]
MELLLDYGAEVEARAGDGLTPLMRACESGNTGTVQQLLRHGADIEARHPLSGWQALHYAAQSGHAGAVSAVLDALGQPAATAALHAPLSGLDLSRRVLHLASASGSAETVRVLVARGAEVDAADSGGNTALHLAYKRGSEAVAAELVRAGAALLAQGAEGAVASGAPSAPPAPAGCEGEVQPSHSAVQKHARGPGLDESIDVSESDVE